MVFFAILPVGIKSNKEVFRDSIEGFDPGAPKNPKIGKKFFITTIITSILFLVIYYIVYLGFFNLRNFLQ
jgi:predicted secreted protein